MQGCLSFQNVAQNWMLNIFRNFSLESFLLHLIFKSLHGWPLTNLVFPSLISGTQTWFAFQLFGKVFSQIFLFLDNIKMFAKVSIEKLDDHSKNISAQNFPDHPKEFVRWIVSVYFTRIWKPAVNVFWLFCICPIQ